MCWWDASLGPCAHTLRSWETRTLCGGGAVQFVGYNSSRSLLVCLCPIRSNFPRLPAVSELISLSGVTGSSSGLRLGGVVV